MPTKVKEEINIYDYLRWRKVFPTVWCSGCGIGTITGAIIRAVASLGIPKDNVSLISGIGCSSRMPIYVDFNTLHTTHGRALAFATGVKLANPEMTVIVVSGDGDGLAIGGNHFIHTARRNIDITMILINNYIYGMTGGQVAPTTPIGAIAHTAPYGNIDPPFDAVKLAMAAGATFVARSTVYHIVQTENYIKKAIMHKGFSFVEIMSQCPIIFGRLNDMPKPTDMLEWQRKNAVPLSKAKNMTEDELKGKIIIGIFKEDTSRKEYTEAYADLIKKVQLKVSVE
ncbi:2-oxoacid:ferredoxin oxidoreductase subunit beta [bacterium]|nr:2-oxoacid:ferredoxin oxidoreductase subunit beta [bacterium]